jgi:periplasmic copper chaperone A
MMAMVKAGVAALLLAGLLLRGPAAQGSEHAIAVEGPFARATAPAAKAGAAYMTLVNRGGAADRLLGATTPRADQVELHTVVRDGDVMRMRQVMAIEVPAGGRVALEPGGYHVMLLGLKGPLKQGETVPLTLSFERAGALTIDVAVGPPGAAGPAEHKH